MSQALEAAQRLRFLKFKLQKLHGQMPHDLPISHSENLNHIEEWVRKNFSSQYQMTDSEIAEAEKYWTPNQLSEMMEEFADIANLKPEYDNDKELKIKYGVAKALAGLWQTLGINPVEIAAFAVEDQNEHNLAAQLREFL